MPRKPKGEEIRAIRGGEIRALIDDSGNRSLEGTIPYNSPSVDLGGFVEIIAPGAFAGALAAGADVLCLRDHKQELLLGRTLSGTLTLSDSAQGLRWRVQLPKTQQAEDLAVSVDRGDLNTNSFGFICNSDGDSWAWEGDTVVRELTSVELLEISPCSFAAYPASTAALRSCPPEMRSAIHLDEQHGHDAASKAAAAEGNENAAEERTGDAGASENPEQPSAEEEVAAAELKEWRENTLLGLEVRKRRVPQRH